MTDAIGTLARGALLLAFCALVFAAIALQFAEVRALYGDDGVDEERVNCPSCGARTGVEAGTCAYCDAPLDGEDER